MVYDRLTARYRFSCPARGEEVRVRLSAFRTLERLPGAAHPAVYGVRFSCPCGGEHESLVTHEELDWAPVGAGEERFFNVMTGRLEPAAPELAEQAAWMIRQGHWPWCFFCYIEERPRPLFPSAFRLVVPQERRLALAARCPGCGRTSVNVVSESHLDVPFYSDPEVDVVEHVFGSSVEARVVDLVEELAAGGFPTATRRLAA